MGWSFWFNQVENYQVFGSIPLKMFTKLKTIIDSTHPQTSMVSTTSLAGLEGDGSSVGTLASHEKFDGKNPAPVDM